MVFEKSPGIQKKRSQDSQKIEGDGEMPVFEDRITLQQYEAIAYRNPEIVGWMGIDMEKMHRNCEMVQKGEVQLQWKGYK